MKTPAQYLRRFFFMLRRFFTQWHLYGFPVAFWTFLFPLHRLSRFLGLHLGAKKHRAILKYLSGRYTDAINSYTERNTTPETLIKPDSTIWVCWWDGEKAMPAIVKTCYNTLLRNAGTHPVQLVTKYNFRDIIAIPEYILKKFDDGIITVTHFSDILRTALLFEYGGIWMDATILVLKKINFEDFSFFTLKAPSAKSLNISLTRFAGLSNSSKLHNGEAASDISRWSGFLLAGTKGFLLFEFMMNFFYNYWKEHHDLIDYFFIDYVIALACDNIPAVKEVIGKVPCNGAEKYVLRNRLNMEFSEEQFTEYCLTPFHKLTWKEKVNVFTKQGKLTIYGHLLNRYT